MIQGQMASPGVLLSFMINVWCVVSYELLAKKTTWRV
jgi:hypothetical protein